MSLQRCLYVQQHLNLKPNMVNVIVQDGRHYFEEPKVLCELVFFFYQKIKRVKVKYCGQDILHISTLKTRTKTELLWSDEPPKRVFFSLFFCLLSDKLITQRWNPSIHSSIFFTAYPTQGHGDPGVYPKGLGAQGGQTITGHTITRLLTIYIY